MKYIIQNENIIGGRRITQDVPDLTQIQVPGSENSQVAQTGEDGME